jgi:glycosyltransferase involved in cell wall biosynthesis
MIDHKENGFLARFQNVEDLANGIRYVLSPENNERLGKAAREKVLECYSEKIVAQQYIKVYEQI